MRYNIDLIGARSTAQASVRRASAFMILGLRALQEPVPSIMRIDASVIGFFPEPISDELRFHIGEEYRAWVIGASLRELEQGYSLFLDQIHTGCFIASQSQKGIVRAGKLDGRFTFENLSKKIRLIKQRFGISSYWEEGSDELVQVRNALAHAAGMVQPRNVDKEGILRLSWIGQDIEIVGLSTGVVERIITDNLFDSHAVADPDGAHVNLKIVRRLREFRVGNYIRLSPHDLHEICHSFVVDANHVVDQATKYIMSFGIPLTTSPAAGGGNRG